MEIKRTKNKKKKILYLITKGNFGGAQRYVYELATSLHRQEFETVVALGEGKVLEKKLKEKNIRVIKVEALARDIGLRKDWQAFREIKKILDEEKPDVLHLNSSKAGGLGALAGRLAGTEKIIFTGHGWAFNEERPWWQRKVLAFFHWLTIMLCHRTIAVSESIRDQVSKWPFTKNRVLVIKNGLPIIKFLEKSQAQRELLPARIGKFWIGTISELHKNKGLDFLIEAFNTLVRSLLSTSLGWSLTLVIIGEGEERKNLENLIKEKKLEDRIFLLGTVEEARRYLKAFDIFTLTSRTEAFPYAPLEAGMAGVPVLASDVGGLPEIIPDAEYGLLVPVGDTKEIEKSLRYLVKKEEYRRTIAKNLEKRVKEEFSIKKMIEKTEIIYKN